MKTVIAGLAAVAALTAIAAPASAQSYRGDHDRYERGGYNLNQRQDRLNDRIVIGLRNGSLTRNEASQLRGESREIARIEARYRVGGLSNWERADLDRRFDRLDRQIARQTHDRDYGSGYGHRR